MNRTNWVGVFSLEEACFCYVYDYSSETKHKEHFAFDSVKGCLDRSRMVPWKGFQKGSAVRNLSAGFSTKKHGTKKHGTKKHSTKKQGTKKRGTKKHGTKKPGTKKCGTNKPGTNKPTNQALRKVSDLSGHLVAYMYMYVDNLVDYVDNLVDYVDNLGHTNLILCCPGQKTFQAGLVGWLNNDNNSHVISVCHLCVDEARTCIFNSFA